MKENFKCKYVLLTAARDEELNIEKTIKSVINQTIKPLQWIIVNDGSKDKTEQIINHYKKKHGFIKLLNVSGDKEHNFGSKVKAVNAANRQIDVKDYDFIGILDADISFSSDYFEKLLNKFESNQKLGIAGGIICEMRKDKLIKQNISLNSVAGAVQFFKYKCFNEIGDFLPLKYGGEDAAMEITARMNSWEVQTFPELKVLHYGFVGKASGNMYKAAYRRGICFYQLSYHPLFQIFRCIYRIKDRPVFIGSLIELFGFFFSYLRSEHSLLPAETVCFLRNEQIQRLKSIIKR